MMDSDDLDQLSKEVIGAAIEVHRVLGPGLLESAHEESLAWELTNREIKIERQMASSVLLTDSRSSLRFLCAFAPLRLKGF